MKQREIQDGNGTTWTCVQAYSGIHDNKENEEAAQVKGKGNTYAVVCTPSGGSQTVRLELPGDWMEALSDEELAEEIQHHQP
jgi:hypothetical protein